MSKFYRTNIYIPEREAREHPKPISGKNFEFVLSEATPKDQTFNEIELIIRANSIERAQLICDLLVCGINLMAGSYYLLIRHIVAIPLDNDEETLFDTGLSLLKYPGIPLICQLVAKASFREKYVNALTKFQLSVEIFSTYWIDLSPSHADYIKLPLFPYEHFRFAYAIVIAYSIIEELGLAVNASRDKPSSIKGEWNPVVKEDLEKRLIIAGINIQESIVWQHRGSKTVVERELEKKPSTFKKKASWSFGNVRDVEIPVVDAINLTSFIRSSIASHKGKKELKSISVYDVDNTQHLARRLLLETLGFLGNL